METEIPNDQTIECAVLGEILIGSESGLECLLTLKSDHFFHPHNKTIFQAACDMASNSQTVDALTVSSKLQSLGVLNHVGSNYLFSLPGQAGGLPVNRYTSILEEKLKLRNIIEITGKAQKDAFNNSKSEIIFDDLENDIFKSQDISKSGNLREPSSITLLENLERKKRGEIITGIKTGIDTWDRMLGGMNPLFYVIAARARMGKTALISQPISRMLQEKRPVCVFQKDMSPDMFILRTACSMANVSFSKYDLGYASPEEYEDVRKAIVFIQKSPLSIYSPSNFTVSTFASIIKKEKRVNGIEAVFLDHILKLDVGQDYRTGLTQASGRIRDSVEENKIPHVILAQLNRGAHNTERPNASHVKEFDALFADCDAMMFLWSEKEFLDVPPNELFPMKLTCGKNRYGSEFEEDIYLDRPLMKFKNIKHKI